MKLPEIIWGTTAFIVAVAIATKTNIIRDLANKVGSRGQDSGYPYGDDCGYFDPVTQLQDMQYQSTQQQEPNFTQPLVTPEQAQKNTEQHHKKKHHTHDDDQQQVYTQIECPDDPNTLPCGSNCYMDGKLYKTVCDEEQRQELFPGSIPSLSNTNGDLTNTVPIHTIPALTYPEDTSTALPPSQSIPYTSAPNQSNEGPTTPYYYNPYRSGGPSPQWPIPTGPGPSTSQSQNTIHPTTSDQNFQDQLSQYDWSKSSHEQQQRRPTTPQSTTPGGPLSLQRSCHPANGWVPEPPHKSDVTASNCDCGKTKLKSSGYMRDSCRKFNSNIGLTDYTIYATVDVGEQTDQSGYSSNRIEITSGGPGIGEEGGCCGVGMDLNLADGSPHIEIENWSPGAKNRDDPICDGESCRQYGWDGVRLGSIYGKPGGQPTRVDMAWRVSHPRGQVRYDGWASANGKSTWIGTLVGNQASPKHGSKKGQTIDPRYPLLPDKKYGSNIEGRVRVDGAKDSILYVPEVVPGTGYGVEYSY